MGPELRQVVQTIMSDLGMGEDQSKIDALEQYLEENLSHGHEKRERGVLVPPS